MRIVVCLLLFVISGCATQSRQVWEHPQGLDADQRLAAQRECRDRAHQEARYQLFFYADPFFPFYYSFYYHNRSYGSSFWYEHQRHMKYQDDLNRLYRFCMEAKGWRLKQIEIDEAAPTSTQ